MQLRFCPRCRADVEDVGGFCLLGHRLPEAVVSDPVDDLRVEVDLALSKVERDVAAALDAQDGSSASAEVPAEVPVWQQLKDDDEEVAEDMRATSRKIYDELSDNEPVSRTDPIIAFSPSPRAEWGPERGNGRRPRR